MWIAALGVWLTVAVPLAAGRRTLFFRDVFSNHLLLKAYGAQHLRAGEIPAFDTAWGLGQPFRGNPSALAFYPDNLLYLALPFWSAYNLHFALHWLLAMLTFWVLARELGLRGAPALAAAVTYAGCGWTLTGLSFYNILTVTAWWPLAMAGAVRGDRRGLAVGGLACGLALLGGEPLTAALGMVPLAWAAVARHGAARGLARAVAVGAIGLAVALPQLVATLRIAGFSFRGGHGMIASQATTYTLHPGRYLELLLPLPFGRPLDFGATGFWAAGLAPRLPFVLTLYCGIVGLWLAAGAVRRRPGWTAVAAAGLLAAWLGGQSSELLIALSGGLFRFPEKFLFWFALAAPLLAGWGLEAAVEAPEGRAVGWRSPRVWTALAGGAVALALALAVAALRPAAVAGAARAALVDTQLGLTLRSLAIAGGLLAAAGWAARRRAGGVLAALQLAALLQLAPLVRTDSTAPYRSPPPWLERVELETPGRGAAVFGSQLTVPQIHPDPPYRLGTGSKAVAARLDALALAPAPGALHGLTYPLYPDLEGLSSPLYTLLLVNLKKLDWAQRVRWLRVTGTDAAVLFEDPGVPGLRRLDRRVRAGVAVYLFAVEGRAPPVWWPERVTPAAGPRDALLAVSSLDDPVATAVVPRAIDHRPGGSVRLLAAGADRVELEVDGPGGVVAVRRSYHPLWTATAGGRALEVVPLDLTLTGVVVPPGRHRVRLAVSALPEAVAAAVAAAAAACCLLVAWRGGRSRAAGAP